MSVKIHYQDKKGGHCILTVANAVEAKKYLSTLRREAVVKDETGRVIGCVIRARASDTTDRRIKWHWYIENEEGEQQS